MANTLMPFTVKFSCGGSLNISVRLTEMLVIVFLSFLLCTSFMLIFLDNHSY